MSKGVIFVKKRNITEIADHVDEQPNKKPKGAVGGHRDKLDWIQKGIFKSKTEAVEAIGVGWKLEYSKGTTQAEKITYYCANHGKACRVKKQIRIFNDREEVGYFETESEIHTNTERESKPLSHAKKEKIREIMLSGTTGALQILRLMADIVDPPTRVQVANFVQREKSKVESSGMNVGELKTWIEQNSALPSDDNTTFVVDSVVPLTKHDSVIRIFLTTKLLLRHAKFSSCVQCDATYKLNLQGYPMIVVGVSDHNRVFHPCGFGVCSGETEVDFEFCFNAMKSGLLKLGHIYKPSVLVADAAPAITNGFTNIFGDDFSRVTCWFHMKEAYGKKLKEVKDEPLAAALQDDIQTLHNCYTLDSWELGSKLWKQKWKGNKDKGVRSFVSYFTTQWLDSNSGWYQGIACGYPTTNNGVESFNALIKKYHTMRLRLQFRIFLIRMAELLRTHSLDRSGLLPRKNFATEATYPIQIEINAFHWHEALTSYYQDEINEEVTLVYVGASGHPNVSTDSVLVTEAKAYRQFKTFKENFFSFHKIQFNVKNWMQSSCSCVCYNEKLVCKHIYGLAVHKGLHSFPNRAIDLPIAGKPKRGRPAKVALARTRDDTQEDTSSRQ